MGKSSSFSSEDINDLKEILEIEKLSKLLEQFYYATGLANSIVDLNGNILHGVGWKSICTEFHRKHEISLERCLKSDTILANQLKKKEKYSIYICKNGMVDVATPITIDGVHIANLLIGQFFFETPDKDFFIKQAEELGFDKKEYIEALEECQIYNKETILRFLDFFNGLINMIGESALKTIKQKKQNEEKDKRAAELIIADKELAFQTQEKADRAAELIIANKELVFQNQEKEKRATELVIANQELASEITLREMSLKKIEELLHFDSLTGLPNRVMLVDRLRQAINLAKRIIKPIGILFLDLDGLRTVNDNFGRSQGDELLKAVAARLVDLVRETDTIARVSGDEFIIMVQNMRSVDDILKVADKIVGAFRQPFKLNQNEINVTTSVGISVFPTDGETYETLIKNADLAMHKAKEKGKNQLVLCNTIMKDIIAEKMKLSNDLYRSLERNEFEVYYQPQINLNTKKIVGLEALLRWNHPELGLVSPVKFIHLMEKTGLINPVGKWVLHTVCTQNKAWQKAGLLPVRIAVNLSIIQFQNHEIVSQIKKILDETKLLPQYLELEITESIAMWDTDHIVRVLNAFQEMDIYISIDDFGTEYSSLTYLKLLPINRIKIPMPFIQGINVDKKDEEIIKTIIVLARIMELDVIAEGVETQQQESFLMQWKCDEIQGYYYYKPMPAKEIEGLLQTNN
ncbi:MAG: EAL domain-containing protein [Dethiosulfatibacter sp.]|nr:EAL domain-containing protein [Dethiosulfatibacter sp.]